MPQRFGFGGLQESETEARSDALNLFDPEPVESRSVARKPCQAKPSAGIQGTGPFQIYLAPERNTFIDVGSIRVHGTIRIQRLTAARVLENLPATDPEVTPVNLFTKCLFKDIEIELESKKISLNSSNTYGVKAYITTALSYGLDAENGHLKCSGWKKDTPGKGDNFAQNEEGLKRYNLIKGSKLLTFCDNLHTELTTTSRYILPGVGINFKFITEDPGLFLITKSEDTLENRIEFLDLFITYDRIRLKEQELNRIEAQLVKTPTIYPHTVTEILTKIVPSGLTSIEWYDAYDGALPEQVVVCMNLQEAADGKNNRNIFNFQRLGMKLFSLIVNNFRIPAILIEFPADSTLHTDMTPYRHFIDNIGIDISNAASLISQKDFMNGSTIIPFDLTSDRCALFHGHEKQKGHISIDIKLSTATTQAINVYLICIYKDYFYITGPPDNRKVHLEYPEKK